MVRKLLPVLCGLAIAGAANARPYPAQTGISAAADSASVASTNPAAMTRFDSRNVRVEVIGFFSDNTWEGHLGTQSGYDLTGRRTDIPGPVLKRQVLAACRLTAGLQDV